MASEYTAAIESKNPARAWDFLLSRDAGAGDEQTASRRRAASYVARFGREGMSCLSLKSESSYWFGAGGCVAYVDTGGSWVAAGAPLCAAGDTEAVAAAFVKAAETTGRRATFFAAEQTFSDEPSLDAVCIGQQPTWDPQTWPSTLSSSRSLREQLRRARAKGVRVRPLEAAEVLDPKSPTRLDVERIVKAWLDTKGLATMGFLVHPEPFALPEARRYLVAERDGVIVECLIASPVPARRGWLVDMTARTKAAPNGTTELLVDALMRRVSTEGCRWVSLGLAPLSGPVPEWMKRVGSLAPWLFDFEGLRAFKARLRPQAWESMYLVHSRRTPEAIALMDALTAFAHGSLLRFGLQTAQRHPQKVAWAAAALAGVASVAIAIAAYVD
jgi:phosphatidylglycerol lysyltransferase